jgi:hypothetical protein
MSFSIYDFNEIITIVYLFNYPDFINIQKHVHFLKDVYISRNSKEENTNIIKTLSNDVIYRSEKEHALKLLKDILMPNIVNHLIDLKYIKNLSSIND